MANEKTTMEQILTRLKNRQSIDEDTRLKMISFFHGASAFIVNMLDTTDFNRTEKARLINTPDHWDEGYNAMVRIYQQYYDVLQKD